jgi:formylglycine-generating enzyme required for sulfatase activity
VSDDITGREPRLSSQYLLPESTGMEPMLGGEHLTKITREAALARLERKNVSHLKRQAIGYYLAEIGDTRPGIGLRDDDLPDFSWCAVPRGEVLLGDGTQPFEVEPFWIARYPVTWQQYRIFLQAPDGHFYPQWWEGLRWRGEYQRSSSLSDNHPAEEVSWYDAVAYTRWLNDRFDYQVRLPTEWEWQQAATGGDPSYAYPWGNRWQPLRANTRESGLRGVTAVGMYPHGASPIGALDMCGTVLEWCANEFYAPRNVEPRGEAHRVMRGGSWFLTTGFARNVSRTGDDPYYRFNSVGFRLATDRPPKID